MSLTHRQFAAFVMARRKEQGLNQPQLAKLVGVTKPTIHYWESGKVVPQVNVLEPLARALKVSYEDLYVLAGYTYPKRLPEPEPYTRTLFPRVSKRRLAEAKRLFAEIEAEEAKRTKKRPKGRQA